MANRHALIACLVATCATGGAQAADNFVLYGIGQKSCGALVEAFRAGPIRSDVYGQWLSGYFSAYNFFTAKNGDFTGQMTEIEGLIEWVRGRCEKKPTELVVHAAGDAITALSVGR